MTKIEFLELLCYCPDDATINIRVDGETNELVLDNGWVEYVATDNLIVLTMSASNPK